MAQTPSGMSPLNSALHQLGALPDRPAQSPKDQFDAIARETNVPANVLMALDSGRGDAAGARRNAQALAGQLGNGTKLDDAVTGLLGEGRSLTGVVSEFGACPEFPPFPIVFRLRAQFRQCRGH